MPSLDLLGVAAILLAVGGLAAVLVEVVVRRPCSLLEMATDARRFAEGAVAAPAAPAGAVVALDGARAAISGWQPADRRAA